MFQTINEEENPNEPKQNLRLESQDQAIKDELNATHNNVLMLNESHVPHDLDHRHINLFTYKFFSVFLST